MPLPCDDATFSSIVSEEFTVAGVIRRLGRSIVGSNYALVHAEVSRLGLDTSHWKGQGYTTVRPSRTWTVPADFLTESSTYPRGRVKEILLREKILKPECAECSLQTWRGKKLSLHLDHINGIRDDNRLENLRLLCPNCHSLTPTYCGRNRHKSPLKPRLHQDVIPVAPRSFCACGLEKARRSLRCVACANQRPTKIEWPSTDDLVKQIESTSVSHVARTLGVSDTAVNKRIRNHGV